jgi:RimJ/RimL family protein N-acetyltransferase
MKAFAAPETLETQRLVLRQARPADAAFIVELLNDPLWIRFIGDRGVRTLDAARDYLSNVLIDMYGRAGIGLYVAQLKGGDDAVGLCGLLKRRTLPDVDIGFAFLPRFRGQGYAYEASRAWLIHGADTLGLERIVAITDPANEASAALLEKLGLRFERMIRLPDDDTELRMYALRCRSSVATDATDASRPKSPALP